MANGNGGLNVEAFVSIGLRFYSEFKKPKPKPRPKPKPKPMSQSMPTPQQEAAKFATEWVDTALSLPGALVHWISVVGNSKFECE